MMNGILIDVTRCTGCERCVAACIDANGNDPVRAASDRATTKDGLSANRLSSVLALGNERFAKINCMHCLEPSCVSACLVGGLTRTAEGAVVYDPDKCIGCRYCMLACPFHIPRYEWEESVPFVKKCSMCIDRQRRGGEPACVNACPNGVLTFGPREELIKEARARIDAPGGNYIPRIWGESEYGGTGVMYVSDVDLDALGWPAAGTDAIPKLTNPMIEKTPFIGLGVASCLLGLNWIVHRRMKLADERQQAVETSSSADMQPTTTDKSSTLDERQAVNEEDPNRA